MSGGSPPATLVWDDLPPELQQQVLLVLPYASLRNVAIAHRPTAELLRCDAYFYRQLAQHLLLRQQAEEEARMPAVRLAGASEGGASAAAAVHRDRLVCAWTDERAAEWDARLDEGVEACRVAFLRLLRVEFKAGLWHMARCYGSEMVVWNETRLEGVVLSLRPHRSGRTAIRFMNKKPNSTPTVYLATELVPDNEVDASARVGKEPGVGGFFLRDCEEFDFAFGTLPENVTALEEGTISNFVPNVDLLVDRGNFVIQVADLRLSFRAPRNNNGWMDMTAVAANGSEHNLTLWSEGSPGIPRV